MSRRVRTALHLLLAIALVVPGIAAPMQAVRDALAHAPASAPTEMAVMHAAGAMPADDMAGMPCEHMAAPVATVDAGAAAHPDNGSCCTPRSCDLSACLGTGCLPELPRIAAFVPPSTPLLPWRQPASPTRLIETPLRPPIA